MTRNRSRLSLSASIAALGLLTLGLQSAEAGRARVVQRTEPGLVLVQFTLPQGTVSVRFPDDMTQGDQVTASLIASSRELAGYEVDFGGTTARVADGRLVAAVPVGESNLKVAVELRNPAGARVARTALAAAREVPADLATLFALAPDHLFLPSIGQAGRPVRLMGPFDGSFEGISVTLGDRPLALLAASPRTLVAATPTDLIGPSTLKVVRGEATTTGDFRAFAIRLQAEKTALRRGETGQVRVEVEGLLGLSEPLLLSAINRTPEVVALNGANGGILSLPISPEAVSSAGTFVADFGLAAVAGGDYAVDVEVGAVGETSHLVNVTTPPHVTATTVYAPHNSHETGKSWPEHKAAVSWPPHTPNASYPPHADNVSWAPHTANQTFPPAHRVNVTWWVHNGLTTWQAPIAKDPASDTDEKPEELDSN